MRLLKKDQRQDVEALQTAVTGLVYREVPYDVPDGWRFELRPPWQRIPLSLKCSQ